MRASTFILGGIMKSIRKGFTLIELLVVIAIIAILAAILFPVFAQAKAAAKKTNDLSNMKQQGLAQLMYAGDQDDTLLTFPYKGDYSNPVYPGGSGLAGITWSDTIMPYVKSRGLFANPSNSDQLWGHGGYLYPGQLNPADTDITHRYRVTVGLNEFLFHADAVNADRPGASSATAVAEPAGIVMYGPGNQPWTFSACVPDAGSNNMILVQSISKQGDSWGYELWGGQNEKGGFGGSANFAYVDGHAKGLRAVAGGTSPSDPVAGLNGSLYVGYFPQAKMHEAIDTTGSCAKADPRSAWAY